MRYPRCTLERFGLRPPPRAAAHVVPGATALAEYSRLDKLSFSSGAEPSARPLTQEPPCPLPAPIRVDLDDRGSLAILSFTYSLICIPTAALEGRTSKNNGPRRSFPPLATLLNTTQMPLRSADAQERHASAVPTQSRRVRLH
ncbi:hypothetical protein AUP68_15572 [Ilyonectria robusta]